VATFPEIMMAQPSVLQGTTATTLMSSAKTLASGWALYQSVSNLKGSWGGATQGTQAGQAAGLASSGSQVLTSLTQTQTQIHSGAQQVQAAKVKLTAIVKAATLEGFMVLPTGQVILGPRQLAEINLHPGMAAFYQARATVYNGQIQAVVATTTQIDLQTGLSLAKVGVDILAAIMNKNNGAAAAPTTTPTLDPGATPTMSIPGATTTPDQVGLGTSLAGVGGMGDLHGISADGGLGGLALPGGAGGLGPAGMTGVGAAGNIGGVGISPGLAGMGGAGAPGETTAGRGATSATGGTSVMGMGGAGRGAANMSDEEREARGWLLAEDEDAWTPTGIADTTNGVIS
jgi:hypothetical protein